MMIAPPLSSAEYTEGDVCTKEQLAHLPEKYLSDDPKRPLLHTLKDRDGTQYTYALRPLFYSVLFILLIELLERFSYYGLANTQLEYLVGHFDKNWNANMTSVQASSFVSSSTALAYTSPFLGGIAADGFLGDYFNIIFGVSLLYLPGLILIALCSYPYALGRTYNMSALRVGMLGLWPLGAGFIKSVVNVFGAKQYHPLLQKDLIESYYVCFYMIINIGALVGGIVLPLVAIQDVATAYTIPAVALFLGLGTFVLGSKRYVKAKPNKDALFDSLRTLFAPLFCKSFNSMKQSQGGVLEDNFVDGVKNLMLVFPATCLTMPFLIVYNQMTTVFQIQGNALKPTLDPTLMQNFDCISVLINGFIWQQLIRPRVNLKTTHKFAIGTLMGALALLSAIFLDYHIHSQFRATGEGNTISIMFQIPSYFFCGAGEILTIALAYDVAFTIAPKTQKGLASGINLFVTGGLSNLLCIALYQGCKGWFPLDATSMEDYAKSEIYKYLWLLVGFSAFGIVFNLLPWVSNWIDRVEKNAVELNSGIAPAIAKDEHVEALLSN